MARHHSAGPNGLDGRFGQIMPDAPDLTDYNAIFNALSESSRLEGEYKQIQESVACIVKVRQDMRQPFKHMCTRSMLQAERNHYHNHEQECMPFSEEDLKGKGLLPANHQIIHPDVYVCRYSQVHVCNSKYGNGGTIEPDGDAPPIYVIPHRMRIMQGTMTCCISARDQGSAIGAYKRFRNAEKDGGSGNRQEDRIQRQASRRVSQNKRRRIVDEREHSVSQDRYNERGEIQRSALSRASIISHISGNSTTIEEALQSGNFNQTEQQRIEQQGDIYRASVATVSGQRQASWLLGSATPVVAPKMKKGKGRVSAGQTPPQRRRRTSNTLDTNHKKQVVHVKQLLFTLLYSRKREAWDERNQKRYQDQCRKRMKQYVKHQVCKHHQLPNWVDLYTIYVNEYKRHIGAEIKRSALRDYSAAYRPVLEQDVCHVIITSWNNLRKTAWAREHQSQLHFKKHALGVLYQMQEDWRTEVERYVLIPQIKLLKECLPPIADLHHFDVRQKMVTVGQRMLRSGYAASINETALINLRIQLPSENI